MPFVRNIVRAVRRGLIVSGLDAPLACAGWPLPRILVPRADEYPRPSIRRLERRGVVLDLDVSDYVQWLTFSAEEEKQRSMLLGLAMPGDTIFDVGTNIGDTLLGLAARVGPLGRVVGFEANPETLIKARANLALNRMDWACVEGIGLGEAEGKMSFGRPANGNSGADRFMPGGGGTIEVPITTIDAFVAAKAHDRVDLIKIDVEGFEMKVLKGAQATLDCFRPTLFVELCHSNLAEQGDTGAGLVTWLEDRGYRLREALEGYTVTATDALDGAFMDVICLPPSDPRRPKRT